MLRSLNATQSEAVTFGDGPLLILAGAGSGKTRVLTSRIAHLVLERGVDARTILAVTFTNKAAAEMRDRLVRLIGDEAKKLWLGTFHSIGLRILRQEARAAELKNDLTVYGDDEQITLIKQVMADLAISDKTFAPKAVSARISQAKNENIGTEEFALGARDFLSEKVAKIYTAYQHRLRDMYCMDFGDLICEPINLFKKRPDIFAKYQARLRHVLVDEYQDTNKAQYVMTNMFASGSRNIFAVGDPDQSIYAWRGADISNILNFEKDYPDATVMKLEQNYRSTGNILAAANAVIEKNTKRLKKTLWTENPDGDTILHEEVSDEYREAEAVLRRLKGLLGKHRDLSYRDIAVFYRTNAQSRVFEEKFIRDGIPYTIVGGVRFYDRMEIKDAIAYLRVISNPNDGISLMRAINTPARRVGPATFDKARAMAQQLGLPLYDAFKKASEDGVMQKTLVKGFLDACEDFKKWAGKAPLHELTLKLLEDSGYMMMWQEMNNEEGFDRMENLFELVSAIKDFEAANAGATLSDFLDQVALISDVDAYAADKNMVTLMTIHSAKGLEFKVVFMSGMEEGLFPHSRSTDDPHGLEEERRLCYVGMTRAREKLFLLSARARTVFGETRSRDRSRFIKEMPSELVTKAGYEDRPKALYAEETRYYTSEGSQVVNHPEEAHPDEQPWKIGMKVMHPSFGIGIIKDRSGKGEDVKVVVNFKDAGTRKLAVKYANLSPA